MARNPLGFTQIMGNKYVAQVAGISEGDVLELPQSLYDKLDKDNGYLMDRARISVPSDETLGQFSGELTAVQPAAMNWGVRIPKTLKETQERVIQNSVDHAVLRKNKTPKDVVVTFADEETAVSLEAMGFRKQSDGAGFSSYRDFLDSSE